MQKTIMLLSITIVYALNMDASNPPNVSHNEAVKMIVLKHLNDEFTKGMDTFKKTCYEYETQYGMQLNEQPYCKQLIAMLDEINGKLEREFHGYKRYDIILSHNYKKIVDKYRKT